MDLCGVRKSGFVDEIEIKATRSDYLADFRKTVTVRSGRHDPIVPGGIGRPRYSTIPKHQAIQEGRAQCNYFSFFLPAALADKCEDLLPEYAGLYVHYSNGDGCLRIEERIKARRLHDRKLSADNKYFIARKMAVKYWYK